MMYPEWLHILALAYIALCALVAIWIAFDSLRHPQRMWVMQLVWPITAMYFGPIAVWLYVRTKPMSTWEGQQPDEETKQRMKDMEATREQVSVSVFHCGAGCTLGDVLGEWCLFAIGGSLATFVAGSEFGTKLVVDFLLAYVFGIFFQYFTIVPMRGLSFGKGVLAAMRADTISILAFEVGMFAWMALTRFIFFPEPRRIYPNVAVFWFMMQIAMIIGWMTSYPANVWLLRKGWKEKMPMYDSVQQMEKHRITAKAA
jgi:Domain of unknown function (DUF4396)